MNLNFPPSFLGARCDLLMDLVVISMAIILPLLWYSVKQVHARNFKAHKNIQLTMFIILFFVDNHFLDLDLVSTDYLN